MFRRAAYTDADDIVKIYNQALKPGIFATNQVTLDTHNERVAWLSEHQDPYPAFVYELDDSKVVGWGSLNRCFVRPECADVAATSHYIDESYRGKGLGGLMLAHLIETATNLGFRLLVSRALGRNIRSIKSGNTHGFQRVAVLHEAVRIRDEWHNDVWLWRKLR